jgi:AcrR family transcriptional regulator
MDRVKDKRTAIMDATLDLISKNGFHGTTMSMVAQEAGVSAGIIYHYFESRDSLIDELYKRVKLDFGQTVATLFQTQPVHVQVRRLLSTAVRYYLKHPLEAAFLEQYTRSPYHRPEVETEISQYCLPAIECLERARRDMIVKDFPEPVIRAFTMDIATSLGQKQAGGDIVLTDELVDRIVEAMWEAIRY